MSIFSRRKIEIDPDDHELVKNMSAQSSETSLFQTQTINITKISQERETGKRSAHNDRQKKNQHFKPSKMSDSFMPSTLQKEDDFPLPPSTNFIDEDTIVDHQFIRPLDAQAYQEEETPFFIEPEITNERNKGITSELDQKQLTDYMQKTTRINRLMVSLIVGVIVIVVIVIIIMLILNLGRSGQTSPLGGV